MNSLRIMNVERVWVSLPFKPRHGRHLTRESPNRKVYEILRVQTNSKLVGIGETNCYYTWGKVTDEQIERVIGRSPFEFLWDDALGAGLQMAIYDLVGKALDVPIYKILGPKVRDWCPVFWWVNDMPAEDWIEEMKEALSLGYMGAKIKARPWRDFAAIVEKMSAVVPSDFRFDADFNGFLLDAGTAAPYLLELEKIPGMDIFESPIPQGDVEGNKLLRHKINHPIAMHYGNPPIQTAIRDEVCDGFVISGGAQAIRRQAALAAQMNKPFWLQMVGTGLTTALMLHFAATLSHARWPAITCHEIYEDDLLKERIAVRHGFAHVPEAPGLGVELDQEAVERYRVEEGFDPPPPRNLYRVVWPCGASVLYPVGLTGVRADFPARRQPVFHRGVRLEIVPDDGSDEWDALFERVMEAPIREA